MQRFVWIIMILSIVIYANQAEAAETLAAKVTLQNHDGYFVLSDGTHWKAVKFSPRWRSLREWWNDVELVPENYQSSPEDWFLGTEIGIYNKQNLPDINEADASNYNLLRQCTHLLVNQRTNQILFAIALTSTECLQSLFDDAYSDGYVQGLADGKRSSEKYQKEEYKRGHEEGYRSGYAEGFKTASEGTKPSR